MTTTIQDQHTPGAIDITRPVAIVSPEVADAFGMRALPNVIVHDQGDGAQLLDEVEWLRLEVAAGKAHYQGRTYQGPERSSVKLCNCGSSPIHRRAKGCAPVAYDARLAIRSPLKMATQCSHADCKGGGRYSVQLCAKSARAFVKSFKL